MTEKIPNEYEETFMVIPKKDFDELLEKCEILLTEYNRKKRSLYKTQETLGEQVFLTVFLKWVCGLLFVLVLVFGLT